MPALANIVINDGQATPVAHTFGPAGPDENGVSYLYDRSGGIAIGFPELSISLRQPVRRSAKTSVHSSNDRVYRAVVAVRVPTMDITSPSTGSGIQPAPSKAYDTMVKMEFLLPERSTLQNRKDILAYAKNVLANTVVTSVVQDLESVY